MKKNSLVKNATILMIATIVSRVIGLLYRRPLGEIIGSVGLGYYGFASNLYSILLLISSYAIPMAISKIVSEQIAKKEYRNSHRTFYTALLYAVIVGGATALVCFFGGRFLLPANQQNALPALRALSPTIFLSAILGVLRGYFQAHRNMTPTSVSQILEQIANAIVSIVAAGALVNFALTAGSQKSNGAAIYGAMGGTIGTGAGVLVGLLFMIFCFVINRKFFKRELTHDNGAAEESYADILKAMMLMITPIIFTSFIYNCSAYVDSFIYSSLQGWAGVDVDSISAAYGEYSSYFTPVVSIPLAVASASTSAMMPEISGRYAVGRIEEANDQINKGMRLSMFICIPAMVGMTILAQPIMGVLFPASTALSWHLLMCGSAFILADSYSIISGGVLQSIGQQKKALINAGIALVLSLVFLAIVLVVYPPMGVYGVMWATLVFSLLCTVLNMNTLRKTLGFRNEIRHTYLEPLAASAIMGAIAAAIYYGLFLVLRRPFICLAAAIVAAIFAYMVLYVKISRTTEEEMRRFPAGGIIVKVLRKIRVFR